MSGTYLQLAIGESTFLFPIEDVQEVSEMIAIRPYPVRFLGHLGVVNLRGQVIPVIETAETGVYTSSKNGRLIIARWRELLFAFKCNSAKKVVLNESQVTELTSTQVTTIDGKPAAVLTASGVIEAKHD